MIHGPSLLARKVNYFESISKPFENLKLDDAQVNVIHQEEHFEQEYENENATAQSLFHSHTVASTTNAMTGLIKVEKSVQVQVQVEQETMARFADESEYRMNHSRRGYALIINNKIFDPKLEMAKRDGTDRDAAGLESSLIKLGFDIKLFHNLTANSMRDIITKFSKIDHSNADCFMCIIMSHGDNGIIYGTDQEIEIEQLTQPFKFNTTLAGKPKLFFIQACRGTMLMEGIDSNPYEIQYCNKIPLQADYLIGYSTISGYFSWRNSANGSWFIQSLCAVLNESGKKLEIMQLLTQVNRRVAYHFESNTNEPSMHGKKQIPCIVSMLTKELYFKPKTSPQSAGYLSSSNNFNY
jgi:hypothetical protein